MRSIRSVNQDTFRLVKFDKASKQELSWGTCFRYPHKRYKECNVFATCKHNLVCNDNEDIALFDIARKRYFLIKKVMADKTLDLAFIVSQNQIYTTIKRIYRLSEGNNYTLEKKKLVASCGFGKSYICLDRWGYINNKNLPYNPLVGEDAFSTYLQLVSGDSGAPILNCYHELIGMHVCRNMDTIEQITMTLPTMEKAFVNLLNKHPDFLDKSQDYLVYSDVQYPLRLLEILESKAPKEVLA